MVDAVTRYTNAVLVKSKKAEVIVNEIFNNWIKFFGAPKRFHSDNGGEFENEVFTEMCELLGVEITTTPAESPFSNGIVERANLILYESMMKTVDDIGCTKELGLAWAVSAVNALQNCSGFSPNQRVFGRNVNLPSIITSKPPAQKTSTMETVRKHLDAIQSAKENFLKADASKRIRKALNSKVRTYSEVHYEPGEKVYFKRKKKSGWCGPGKVLGKDRNIVLVDQGGRYYRCHPCHLMKIPPVGGNDSTESNSGNTAHKMSKDKSNTSTSRNTVSKMNRNKSRKGYFSQQSDSSDDDVSPA